MLNVRIVDTPVLTKGSIKMVTLIGESCQNCCFVCLINKCVSSIQINDSLDLLQTNEKCKFSRKHSGITAVRNNSKNYRVIPRILSRLSRYISWITHFLILAGSAFYQIWLRWFTSFKDFMVIEYGVLNQEPRNFMIV